jgi:hypothetical protein
VLRESALFVRQQCKDFIYWLSVEPERLVWPLAKTASTRFFSAAILPSVVKSGRSLRRVELLEEVLLFRAGIFDFVLGVVVGGVWL